MKNNHEITLKQYAAYCEEQPVYLGTADSYGMETLTIIREGVWAEYDILATFHPPVGAAVQVRVGVENCIDVPAEATAEKGMGEIVFAGYKEGVRQIAMDVLYKVAPSSGANGTEPAEPTPDVVQQIMSAAGNAEKLAQSVRDDADAGKFTGAKGDKGPRGEKGDKGDNGERGEKGDPGKDAVIDITLSHAGEAADAAEVGKLKEDTAALQKRQNVLIGSETGNPVSCDDAFAAPLCGLHIYGKSTQDGTPTTDAPVPIVSAGDGGNVLVTLSDGNNKEQTLTLQTPTGLHGIPVISLGNYTDPSGQQWVCDEIDLERGVKVQRVKVKELSPLDRWKYVKLTNGNNNVQTRLSAGDIAKNNAKSICNILPFKNVIWNDNIQNLPKIYVNDQEITASFPPSSEYSSVEAFKQLLTNVKSVIYYALVTPIETPLTADEIAAYKALTAYAPNTVVQASDGAGIRLGYQRDVNLVVKNLEDAIASMTIT